MTPNTANQSNAGTAIAAILAIVGALVILYFIVTFAVQATSFMASNLSQWGADVDGRVMAAIISAFLMFLVTQLNASRQSRSQFANQNSQKKLETYHNAVRHLALSPFSAELLQLDPELDAEDTNNLAADIITCGSNDVIKAFRAWRVAKEEQDPHAAILAGGNLLLAIRKDLKLNNKHLSSQDLMRCIMKGE